MRNKMFADTNESGYVSFNFITKNAVIGDNVRRFVEEYRDGFLSTRASARIDIHELRNANDSCLEKSM